MAQHTSNYPIDNRTFGFVSAILSAPSPACDSSHSSQALTTEALSAKHSRGRHVGERWRIKNAGIGTKENHRIARPFDAAREIFTTLFQPYPIPCHSWMPQNAAHRHRMRIQWYADTREEMKKQTPKKETGEPTWPAICVQALAILIRSLILWTKHFSVSETHNTESRPRK